MFELCNDLILAQRCRKGAVHPNSLATISSGLCLFLDIDPSSSWLRAIPQGGPLLRGQTTTDAAQHLLIDSTVLPVHLPVLYLFSALLATTDSGWWRVMGHTPADIARMAALMT